MWWDTTNLIWLVTLLSLNVATKKQVSSIKCVPITECRLFSNLVKTSWQNRSTQNLLNLVTCGTDGSVFCAIINDTPEEPSSVTHLKPNPLNVNNIDEYTEKSFIPNPFIEEEEPQILIANPLTLKPTKNDHRPRHRELPTDKECSTDIADGDRIVGGTLTSIDEYPWLAVLNYEGLCGGMLITRRHVLTAAHCITSAPNRPKSVVLGEYNLDTDEDCVTLDGSKDCNQPPVDVKINRITIHPGWLEQINRTQFYDDIAILQLERPVNFTHFIKPLCLPSYNFKIEAKKNFTAAGWGLTDWKKNDSVSSEKLQVSLPPFPRRRCTNTYGKRVSQKQICAGGDAGKDTCKGDSGGPLMYFDKERLIYVAAGIVSLGNKMCGTNGVPGIYTYIPSYLDWILENLDPKPAE